MPEVTTPMLTVLSVPMCSSTEQPGTDAGVEMRPEAERDVVPGLQVQLDVLDADLAEFHLRIANLSHDSPPKNCANQPGSGRSKTAFQPPHPK